MGKYFFMVNSIIKSSHLTAKYAYKDCAFTECLIYLVWLITAWPLLDWTSLAAAHLSAFGGKAFYTAHVCL
jgi:hypothetical protein